MGWTSYHATYYKPDGKVDRKAECDAYFMEGLNRGHFKVLRSTLVGGTYYAAVQNLKKYTGKDSDGNSVYEDVPKEERITWAAVFRTNVDNNDYYNFAYKDMDETVGPGYYDCPKAILDLLSETDSEYAKAWRQECINQAQEKKNKKKLINLAAGTIIQFMSPKTTNVCKKGETIELEKDVYGNWRGYGYTWPLRYISGDYKIVKRARNAYGI